MNKTKVYWGLLSCLLLFQGLLVMPESGRFVVDIGTSYINPFKFNHPQQLETWQHPLSSSAIINTNNSQFDANKKVHLKGGLTYFFNDGFLGIGFDFSSVKAKLEIINSFQSTLSGPEPGQMNRKWSKEGSARTTPLSLNAVCRIPIGENTNVNLEAGPTLYLCSIQLNGGTGGSIIDLNAANQDIPSQYDVIYFDITGTAKKTVFGGNIKLTIDFSMARKIYDDIYFYVGLNYFFPAAITGPWKIKKGEYASEALTGNEIHRVYEQDFPLENYNWQFKINKLILIAGIKFHL
jgi:hypothetical protein